MKAIPKRSPCAECGQPVAPNEGHGVLDCIAWLRGEVDRLCGLLAEQERRPTAAQTKEGT